jgi:hypothetical protein
MRRKSFSPSGFFSVLLWITLFCTVTVFQTGCNNNETSRMGTDKPIPTNWVALNIKFKPNTTNEMRDLSIRTIEKLLIDSVKALRMGKHPNFSPTIAINKDPLGDSLDYGLSVPYVAKDTISNPTCRCVNNCGVCFVLHSFLKDTSQNAAPYRIIADISFPEDDSKR